MSDICSFARFSGQQQFIEMYGQCVIEACKSEDSHLILCDSDFAHWPLADQDVLNAMQEWAAVPSNQRVMDVVCLTYNVLAEKNDAWVRWRRQWEHRVRCWSVDVVLKDSIPSVFWSDHCVLVLSQPELFNGFISNDRQRIVRWRAQLDTFLRYAQPASPVTVLGL